jgi:hypothetical protein
MRLNESVIITNRCPVCDKTSIINVTDQAHDEWQAGEHVQDIWPEWSASKRELLISGTHSKCWEKMWWEEP